MSNQPLVVAIIVNWNQKNLLELAIKSLLNSEYPNIKIIVVDNASKDGSVEMVRNFYSNVILIDNNKNLGFSRGNNQGIEVALRVGADFLFFLNNDATIAPRCLSSLVSIFQSDPKCGSASPFILYADKSDTIWFGGGEVSLWSGIVKHLHIRKKMSDNYKNATTEYITACAMMVRSETIQQVGGFDERYALYSEDVDLSLRIRKAGWSLNITPGALAFHSVSASTGGGLSPFKAFYRARSTAILLRRWGPWWVWCVVPIFGTIGLLGITAGLIVKGQPNIIPALWQGIYRGLTGAKIPEKYQLEFTK